MAGHLRAALIVLVGFSSVVAVRASAPPSQSTGTPAPVDFPPGPNRDIVIKACTDCHPVSQITRRRESRVRWAQIVDRMAGEGAQMTDAESEKVVVYLSVVLGRRVRINEASAATIGETFDIDDQLAAAIVKYRTDKGPFKTWKDLLNVPGIDPGRVEEQKDNLDFGVGPYFSSAISRRWISPSTTL
jgi:competence protein ComEA